MSILDDFDDIATKTDIHFSIAAQAEKNIKLLSKRIYKNIQAKSKIEKFKAFVQQYTYCKDDNNYHIESVSRYIVLNIGKDPVDVTIEAIESEIRKELSRHHQWVKYTDSVFVVNPFFKRYCPEQWMSGCDWAKKY